MSVAKVSFILGDMYRYMYRRIICVLCINAWNSAHDHHQNSPHSINANHVDPHEPNHNNNHNAINSSITSSGNNNQTNNQQNVIVKDVDERIGDDDNQTKRVDVPLVIVLGTFIAYIVFGAYIFIALESLTWVKSIYFCYISLATIGKREDFK